MENNAIDSDFIVQRDGRIATVSINRPERRNAFKWSMWDDLANIVGELGADNTVSVIVIRGAGRQAFSAGADLNQMDVEQAQRVTEVQVASAKLMAAMDECPKATIAMVYGYAMGGGCGVAIGCDLRIVGESARFSIPSAKLCVVYPGPMTAALLRAVGPSIAKRMLFTGELIDARTALNMGIASMVFPDDRLEAETYALAQRIAKNAPLSIAGSKEIIRTLLMNPRSVDSQEVVELTLRAARSEDRKEALRAYRERRDAVFHGK